MNRFEIISEKQFKKEKMPCAYEDIIIPTRATKQSAGYDFVLPYDIQISANSTFIVKTGIKIKLEANLVLMVFIRSGICLKYGVKLLNQVGIIDSDYYNNTDNEGHILIVLQSGDKSIPFFKGSRIAQGIILPYLTVDNEKMSKNKRIGGFGSTKL